MRMEDSPVKQPHFNRRPARRAEIIKPSNALQSKVGSGGLDETIIQKAQTALEKTPVDYRPLGDSYLAALIHGVERAKNSRAGDDREDLILALLQPAAHLKASGSMCRYPLITKMADRLVEFLEVVKEPDEPVLEIVLAFHAAMNTVLKGRITGPNSQYGEKLIKALNEACWRYFERFPEKRA